MLWFREGLGEGDSEKETQTQPQPTGPLQESRPLTWLGFSACLVWCWEFSPSLPLHFSPHRLSNLTYSAEGKWRKVSGIFSESEA